MSLRIASNQVSQAVQTNLTSISSREEQSLSRLSSGKRINRSADNPAGLAIATRLRAQVSSLRQANQNANDAVSLVQTAEGGMSQTSNNLIRMREIATQAASNTIGLKEKELLNLEYQQLLEEIDRTAEATFFNGIPLLNGRGESELTFQVGTFAGEENRIEFDAGSTDIRIDSLGIDGTGVSTISDSRESLSAIDNAIDQVSMQRASLGAVQSRLHSTVSNLEVQAINQDMARAVIEDVDVANETSELASASILKHASIASLSQANNIPKSALKLI